MIRRAVNGNPTGSSNAYPEQALSPLDVTGYVGFHVRTGAFRTGFDPQRGGDDGPVEGRRKHV
jgi:hypothetical protein